MVSPRIVLELEDVNLNLDAEEASDRSTVIAPCDHPGLKGVGEDSPNFDRGPLSGWQSSKRVFGRHGLIAALVY